MYFVKPSFVRFRFSRDRAFKSCALAMVAFAVAACTMAPSYIPPEASNPAQEATIRGSKVAHDWPLADQITTIALIDGREPSNVSYDEPIEVSPGEHTIGLQYTHGNRRAGVVTSIDFEAGKAYVAKSEEVGSGWLELGHVHFTVEETDTGRVVAQESKDVDYQAPTPAFIPR